MITEEGLRDALRRAAGDLEPPPGASEAILAAARAGGTATGEPSDKGVALSSPRRRRRLIVAASTITAAAVAALVVGLSLPSSGPQPTTGGVALPRSLASGSSAFAEHGASSAQSTPNAVVLPPVATSPPATKTTGGTSGVPAKVASSGTLALGIDRAKLNADVAALRALASGAGGYISSTNLNEASKTGNGALTLSVPATTFTDVVGKAEHLGTVRSLVTNAKDVTQQYADTAAQLQALTDVRSQLETLLGRATKVSDLLAVETQIQNVETQIDELQATQRSLDQEVTYATLNVELQVHQPAKHASGKPSALSRAWSDAVSGFTGGLRWLLSISGALLFSLLIAAVALFGVRAFIRRGLPRLRRFFL